MSEEKQPKRRFSLEDDFMKSKIDQTLYGLMRCWSTTMPADTGKCKYTEYLYASNFIFSKHTKLLADLCGIKTQRTFRNHILKLIEVGLVEEGSIKVNGKDYACYFFPYDYDGAYKLISKELLEYLVYTGNKVSIKVYLYLLNCSTCKDSWEFTNKDIVEAIGYDREYQPIQAAVKAILENFRDCGLINFEEVHKTVMSENGKQHQYDYKVLKYVLSRKPNEDDLIKQ